MSRIITLGGALQDIYFIDRENFTPTKHNEQSILGKLSVGTKNSVEDIAYEIGGGGVNTAISFARHGHESILFSNISHDSAGDAIISKLDEEGIDTSFLNFIDNQHTGSSAILLDAKSGERTILTYRGASSKNDNFKEDDLDLVNPDWIYSATLGGNMSMLMSIFEKAHSIDAKIMFNPGVLELSKPKQLIGLLSEVDILIVNKTEASKIVSGNTLAELLYRLANYVQTVIITDASTGGIATNGEETYRFGIYEDTPIKDTTGAGDAFGSGFLAHLIAGNSFKKSLVFASANATSVVTKLGANAGILTGKEKLHQMPIQLL